MSIRDGKVRIYLRKRGSRLLVGALVAVQAVLTLFLSISLAADLIYPQESRGAAPAPMQIAYEGRLTDASGNALGGTGSQYCFRFSIYDAPTGGTKLWPGGTPGVTTATTSDGVFSTTIGLADTLTSAVFDFSTTSTAYLQVDVSTSSPTCSSGVESLSPRQQILSSSYAMSANSLGSYVTADYANSRVRIGSGAGTPSPVYLGLDWKSTIDYVGQTCSVNGLIWYNSNVGQSSALICNNGVIEALGNSGTTTIAAITANAGTPATAGTIAFSNSNGVSFGINGNTITASVNAGGGGSTLNSYVPILPGSTGSQTLGAMGATTGSAQFYPVSVASYLNFNAVRLAMNFSFATSTVSGQETVSHSFGLYSLNGNNLSLISSNSLSYAVTNSSFSATLSAATATATTGYGYGTITASTTAQIHSNFGTRGLRVIDLQFGNTMSVSPGMYWLGFLERKSSSSANIGLSIGLAGNVVGAINSLGRIGSNSAALTTNFILKYPYAGFGPYTSTGSAGYGGTALPSSVFLSGIAHTGSVLPFMTFIST